jgi:UDP-2,3-diacylglucosamine hydrolase
MKPVYFISDIHAGILGDQDDESKLADFRQLAAVIKNEASELILLGDIFDFWFQWKEVVPARHFGWLYEFHDLVRSGIPVHIFPGNHDFRLAGFLEDKCGLQVQPHLLRREMLGKKIVLTHGDGLDPKDRGYRLLKAVIQNNLSYKLFSYLHPNVGMKIADWASDGDRTAIWENEELMEYLARSLPGLIEKGDDFLVMGHVHYASESDFENCKVYSLPPFTASKRGHGVFDGEKLRFEFLR